MSDSSTTTSFMLFPNLPLELRTMIWKYSLEPRIVEMTFSVKAGFSSRNTKRVNALEINQESRKAIINAYPLCFGCFCHRARTRFNFSIDTIFLNSERKDCISHCFDVLKDFEIKGIQHLAIDHALFFDYASTNNEDKVRATFEHLDSLETLQLVYQVPDMLLDHRELLGCRDRHPCEFLDKIPPEFASIKLRIWHLPSTVKLRYNKLYCLLEGLDASTVYGWRKCPLDLYLDSCANSVADIKELKKPMLEVRISCDCKTLALKRCQDMRFARVTKRMIEQVHWAD